MKTRTLILSLLMIWCAMLAQTPPGLPKLDTLMGAKDSTGQRPLYLNFHAEAGVVYMLETTDDLVGGYWYQTGARVYGLGTDVRLPVYTFQAPDPVTHEPVEEQYTAPSELITLMFSRLSNGQGIAVSWSDGYGSFSSRQVYPTTSSLTSVPFSGTWRSADVDMIWSKMGEVNSDDPTSLNTSLSSYQQFQWTQIQAAMPDILTGTGGAIPLAFSGAPTLGPDTKRSRFFRLQLNYPDSDNDGIPDWLEFAGFTSGGIHYSSNPFTSDSDGDGITDAEEWAAGTNPNDANSHPYKVMAITPAVGDGGSPLNGAVIIYFNDALPTSFSLSPTTNLLWHVSRTTTVNGAVTTKTYSLDPVAGTYSILAGRKTVVFYPAQNLLTGPDNGDSNFPKFNYLYDITTTSTGLDHLIPLTNLPATLPPTTYSYSGALKGFSTTTLYDTIGPAVMKASPAWGYVDVATDVQPVVTWNQPLDPATVNTTNVTLVTTDTSTSVACSVSFDYGLESYFDNTSNVPHWRPALKLKLVPNAALLNDTNYTVTLGTGLTNLKGLPLLNAYSWSFHTRPAPATIVAGAGPYIVSTTPAAYNKGVDANRLDTDLPLTVTFSGAMDASTLTTSTVHLSEQGSGVDEQITLSYDPATKTLSIFPSYLQVQKHYELHLDSGDIQGAGATGGGAGSSLQGDTLFPFGTAGYAGDDDDAPDPNHPAGTPNPTGTADPNKPSNISLALTVGDYDAGSSGTLLATLPDGKTQVFPIPAVTDGYKTTNSPEFPNGTSFVITPEFTKGSDDEVTHEKIETGVGVFMANTAGTATASNYLVFVESNGATTYDGTLDTGYHIAHCAATIVTGGSYTAGPPEKLKLNPIKLINKTDPTKRNSANGTDKTISFKQSDADTNIESVAWIAAHDPSNNDVPRMPKLVASAEGLAGYTVCWKLEVIFHDRNGNPHRDFDTGDPNDQNGSGYLLKNPIVDSSQVTADTPDWINIPLETSSADTDSEDGWHKITDGSAWNIYDNPDWQAEVAKGFFGGDAVLSLKILSADGTTTLQPQVDFKFRIAGENPDPTKCKNYIISKYGGPNVPARDSSNPNAWSGHFWFAHAIAKEETEDEGGQHFYNQFLYRGKKYSNYLGHEGCPNWNDDSTTSGRLTGTGGYGIFQHTYESANKVGDTPEANYIIPRSYIWNWQSNVDNILPKLNEKLSKAQATYNALAATYPSPSHITIPNHLNFNALESLLITFYNGGGGQLANVPVDGKPSRKLSCWLPHTNDTGWDFLSNQNDYVDKVNSVINQ